MYVNITIKNQHETGHTVEVNGCSQFIVRFPTSNPSTAARMYNTFRSQSFPLLDSRVLGIVSSKFFLPT
jgi:hypothetical protein